MAIVMFKRKDYREYHITCSECEHRYGEEIRGNEKPLAICPKCGHQEGQKVTRRDKVKV